MKKLLSLLSVLTISGSAVPTTIAASPYQKKETIKNSEINYSQTNNLEILNRQKRENNETLKQQRIVIRTNSGISSSGIVLNNKLYWGSSDNNVYEYDPVTGEQKIVIRTNRGTNSRGTALNNKIYFSSDNDVYEYDPATGEQKIVIKANKFIKFSGIKLNNKLYFLSSNDSEDIVYEYDTETGQQRVVIRANGWINYSGIILNNNKMYFGSTNSNVYEYDTETGEQKIVIRTNRGANSRGTALNNKIYFSSDNDVYEYDPATGQQKIVIRTNSYIHSSGVVLNNKLYFGSLDYNVYEYDPATGEQKIVIRTNGGVEKCGIALNNKFYVLSYDNNVYEYDPATGKQKTVISLRGSYESKWIVLNNKLYFNSYNNFYEYDPATGQQKIVIIGNSNKFFSSGAVLNNKLYFVLNNNNIYEYDPATGEQKIVIRTNGHIISSGVVLNNKIYWGSGDHNVYEYYEKINLNKTIKNFNLNLINNDNEAILNELNYLNPTLDITQLELVNKTNTSVTIKAKYDSDKYFGEKKIYYMINNEQDKIINLYELIKKGLFFKFHDENLNLIFKEIKIINTDNLIYSNVTATKTIEPIYSKNNKSICFGKTTLLNDLSETKIMKSPSCKYTKEKIINTKITTGLSKTNSEEKRTEQKSSLNIEHNLNFELGANVQAEAGVWPFKISAGIDAKAGYVDNYNSLTTNTSLETKNLSNKFNFSSTKIDEYKEISEVELPSQEITIYPNKKIKIIASLEEVSAQVTLNLKQNIYGEINAKIITLNNEEKNITLSIKEIMQKLKKYNLLPQEITINNDDTITFNGKANRSLKQGFDSIIEFHEVK